MDEKDFPHTLHVQITGEQKAQIEQIQGMLTERFRMPMNMSATVRYLLQRAIGSVVR